MPLFRLSDLHLCERGPRDNFAYNGREERFNNFLNMVEAAGGQLLILGDLFDWWLANRWAQHHRLLAAVGPARALGASVDSRQP